LDLLLDMFARARHEREPQLATLVGVPGIGKSRLVLELRRLVEREGAPLLWRQGRSLPYGDGISLWALGEIVRAQIAVRNDDTAEEAEAKLRRMLEEAVAGADERAWLERHLRPLLGLG